MKELFSGTDKCTTHNYCAFYADVFKNIPEHPAVLNISPTAESDTKAILQVLPTADVWCLTSDREDALGAVRAGARALCADMYDVSGLNDWFGAQQFDLIIDDGYDTAKQLHRITEDEIKAEMDYQIERLQQFLAIDGCKSLSHEGGFDTKYFAGENVQHEYYYVGGIEEVFADNEVNYIGIGLYEAWLCHSLVRAKLVTRA